MARQIVAGAVAEEQRLPMTFQQWVAWAGESTQSEWEDGEAIVFMPPNTAPALASTFTFSLLSLYVDVLDLGRVIFAPFEMRLARSAREPDILVVAGDHLDRLTAERLVGPADLAVEFISDDSVTRDRVRKLAEYAEAGVPEYWIFDPRPRRRIREFHQLTEQGTYQAVAPDPDRRYHSLVLPGFWLRPAWLWQEPLPKPLALLATIVPGAVRAEFGGILPTDGGPA